MFGKVKNSPSLWLKKTLFGNMIDEAWTEGYNNGREKAAREIENILRRALAEGSLNDFSSDELKLGYNVAQGIVTEILDGKR